MNLLSLFSFFNFVCFLFSLVYLSQINTKTGETRAFILTNASLAIWVFAYTFFYVSETKEIAWFWHKIGIIGGLGFPCFSVFYFFQITKTIRHLKKSTRVFFFAIVPILLLILNVVFKETACATDLVKSTSGLGWTYINSTDNLLYWTYIVYIFLYFSVGFFVVYQWGKNTNINKNKKQSRILILLFGGVLLVGMITDFVLPLFTIQFPPIANLLLIFVVYGDWLIIERYSFFSAAKKSSSSIILKTIKDAVLLLDLEGTILRVNPAFTEMIGFGENQIIGKNISHIVNNKQVIRETLNELIKGKNLRNRDVEILTANEKIMDAVFSASLAEDDIKDFLGIVLSFHDVTERKKMESILQDEKIKYKQLADEYYELANFDTLTSLPNRRFFLEKVQMLQQHYQETQQGFALIFIDLNKFKEINDQYGHNVGDEILIEAAKRLGKCVFEEDILARIGGDEFVMLLPHSTSNKIPEKRIALIKSQFSYPIIIDEVIHDMGISAGAASYPNENENISDLLRMADEAMYEDKENYRQMETT